MKTITVPQGSLEWLEVRKQYVTATEISSLLGLNPYRSAAAMLKAKSEPPEFISNEHTRRGKILEPAVMELCNVDYNLSVTRWAEAGIEEVLVDDSLGISCTPDGQLKEDNEKRPVECKTVLYETYIRKWLDLDTFPSHYLLQLYMQIWLADTSKGYLVGMALTNKLHHLIISMKRSEELEAIIIEELQRLKETQKEGKRFRSKSTVKKRIASILKEISVMKLCEHSQAEVEALISWEDIVW